MCNFEAEANSAGQQNATMAAAAAASAAARALTAGAEPGTSMVQPLEMESCDLELNAIRAPPIVPQARKKRRRHARRACIAVGTVLLSLYGGLTWVLSSIAVSEMVTIHTDQVMRYCEPGLTMVDLIDLVKWPGCDEGEWKESCTMPCYSSDLLERVRAFNGQFPGKLVKYSSRPEEGVETVELTGWYLAAPPHLRPRGRPAPRVVLQHGFRENSNYFRYVLMAYMLRISGVDVIVNNFRDHCYSGNSTAHVFQWGHAYPYDLLGAWDYARNDPEGEMGGPLSDELVGLQGFSKGGFTTLNAFGLDGRVPAAWVDGPPFMPDIVFGHGAKRRFTEMGIPEMLAGLFISPAWGAVSRHAESRGIDLHDNVPEHTLPLGPDTSRPLFVVHNRDDDTVPITENTKLRELLSTVPDKYDLKGDWTPFGTCHGNGHCVDHLRVHDDYLTRLCTFWRSAFKLDASACVNLAREREVLGLPLQNSTRESKRIEIASV